MKATEHEMYHKMLDHESRVGLCFMLREKLREAYPDRPEFQNDSVIWDNENIEALRDEWIEMYNKAIEIRRVWSSGRLCSNDDTTPPSL